MPIFYVHQKQSYQRERDGGFVWSPQNTQKGGQNIGYHNMTKIQKGDFILHHSKGYIKAIGIAKGGFYTAIAPSKDYSSWNQQGYRVDVEYFELDCPINVLDYQTQISALPNYETGKAFTNDGKPTQHYMCVLTNEQASFLLTLILSNQTASPLKTVINKALLLVREVFYIDNEDQDVNSIIESSSITATPSWNGLAKAKETVMSTSTNRVLPKRNATVAVNALCIAGHKCEVDPNHKTFKRKVSKFLYMESHHLIPISRFQDFHYSLDIEENIVSLCPTCHRLLHHGSMREKEPILKKLWKSRKQQLKQCGIDVSFNRLKEYYE